MTRNLKEFVNHEADLRTAGEVYGPDHVAILLAHYNGEAFLSDQLESLATQSHRDWSLIVSDDGSSDGWLQTVVEFSKTSTDHRVWLVSGPGRGFARNFLTLSTIAGPSVPYVAYCDQDDVWMPDKLARAIAALKKVKAGVPALYCSRTSLCDASLNLLGLSPRFSATPSFRNALVQNIGGGNTMVLNRAAVDLVQDTSRHAGGIVSHDWWTYQLVTGAGGHVIYDPEPSLLYRQHGMNCIGANTGLRARLGRLRQLLRGEFRAWNDAQTKALQRSEHWLTPDARASLELFRRARQGTLPARISALRKSSIYRQTWQGQCALWIATLLKRL